MHDIIDRLHKKGMWFPINPAPPAPEPAERFEPDADCREAAVEICQLRVYLRSLEEACDEVAATRSQETYLSMIDNDHAQQALENLDAARRKARSYFSDISDKGDTEQ